MIYESLTFGILNVKFHYILWKSDCTEEKLEIITQELYVSVSHVILYFHI